MLPEYRDLVGASFAWGGRGPDAFDCYGLVMELHRRRGIALPDYRSPTDGAEGGKISAMMTMGLQLWKETPKTPGALIMIRLPFSSHVATVIDDLRMIHTWEGSGGVVIERIATWKHRIQGFYEYAG